MDTTDTLINQLITEDELNVTVLNNVSNIKPFTIPHQYHIHTTRIS